VVTGQGSPVSRHDRCISSLRVDEVGVAPRAAESSGGELPPNHSTGSCSGCARGSFSHQLWRPSSAPAEGNVCGLSAG